jgi:enoyl-CoA hydratase/carnithine racemase
VNSPEISIKNEVGLIVLSNPNRHNCLTIRDINEIKKAVLSWKNQKVKVLIITGTGKSFCSGMSINELSKKVLKENPIGILCDVLESFPGPTICALNGGVYGGAVEIALACDFRIGYTGISMFVPAAKLGIHY